MNFASQNNYIYFIYTWIMSSTNSFIEKTIFLFENTLCILLYLYLIIIHNKISYFLWCLIKKFLIF